MRPTTFLFSLLPISFAHPPLHPRVAISPSPSGAAVDMTSGEGGTYPRANFLSSGNILGAYTAFPSSGAFHQLTLTQSTDSGASWDFLGTAATRPTDSSDLDNPYPLQLPSGRVLLAYRNHDRDRFSGGAYTYFRITISYSDDGGRSWKWLADAVEREGGTLGVWEPLLRISGNSVQLYYSYENAADDQDNLMISSTDEGVTWGAPVTVSGAGITARDGMTGVTSVNSSTVVAVFESEQDGLFTVNCVFSADAGSSWYGRERVYTPTGTRNNAGAPQVVNVAGTLVVSFMTDEDTQEHSWTKGADAKVVTSDDAGASWGNKITVFPVQTNWPGLLALDYKSFLYMADHGGAKSQTVVLS